MSVQLRCSVPIYWPGTIVLETGCYPFARCFRRMIAADTRLDVFLHFIKRNFHAVPMRLAYSIVSADESGQGHAFRRGERCIPGCAVLHCAHRLAAFIYVFARGLVAH